MSGNLEAQEMAELLAIPAFRRLLWRISEAAGIVQSTYGTDGRDLAFREGRRSLGLDILRMADAGQPIPHAHAVSTLIAVLSEEEKSHLEAINDRRRTRVPNRYERERSEPGGRRGGGEE